MKDLANIKPHIVVSDAVYKKCLKLALSKSNTAEEVITKFGELVRAHLSEINTKQYFGSETVIGIVTKDNAEAYKNLISGKDYFLIKHSPDGAEYTLYGTDKGSESKKQPLSVINPSRKAYTT